MTGSEIDDDEDWPHDSNGPDDEWVPCPDCGREIAVITGNCRSCGYWLTEADEVGSNGRSKPLWVKATVAVVVIALLAGLLIEIAIRLF